MEEEPSYYRNEDSGQKKTIEWTDEQVTDKDGWERPKHSGGPRKVVGNGMIYRAQDTPAVHLCILFGLQQAVMCIGGTISLPLLLSKLLCAEDQNDVRAKLLSITLFMCGLATFLQTTIGIRLPIIQGGSHTFVPPILAMMALDQWKCRGPAYVDVKDGNSTVMDDWTLRMREVQGNLMVASLVQVVLGFTGLVGYLMRFVGPLTISPTIGLIGFSLVGVTAEFAEQQWGIAFMTTVIIIFFSVCVNKFRQPIPVYSRGLGCHIIKYPVFQLLPIFLGITITWLFCYVLTVTDVFPPNATDPSYKARTDYRTDVMGIMPWFYWPTPFQFGIPTVSAAGVLGILSAVISSVMESVGDYHACARISEAPLPPVHAINRGIGIEGVASIVSGMVGAGHATTSYSNNIGAIGMTKVASLRVFQTAGVIMVICGIVGKFGAALSLIPDPIIGGTLLLSLALVISIAMSVLQFVDLSSIRNLTVLGVSYFVGMMSYLYLEKHPGVINTGHPELDNAASVLLGTASFFGGILAFVMDNIIPGTDEERGLHKWRESRRESLIGSLQRSSDMSFYDLPFITKYLRRNKFWSYLPFSPTFDKQVNCSSRCCRRNKETCKEAKETYEQTVEMEGGSLAVNGNNYVVQRNGPTTKL